MQRTSASSRRPEARWQRARPAALLALFACSAVALAADTQWRDVESRIQYGYYTEDPPALRGLAELISSVSAHDRLRGYYAGLLAWRQALLAEQGVPVPEASSAQLAQRCVSALDAALAIEADFADALALRALCLATPLSASGLHAPFSIHKVRRDLERALQLAPRNPRVLLLEALSDYELAPERGGNKERALPKLRQTVAAFEAERSDTDHLPGWGAADAWLLLGRDLLDHNDPIGARDALERALLIAPEYAQARRLMARITSG